MVRLDNSSKPVDETMCLNAGLYRPISHRKCCGDKCAHWRVDRWTSVSK